MLEGLVIFVSEVTPFKWTGLAASPQILKRGNGRNSDVDKTYNWLRIACKSQSPVFTNMSHQNRNNFATRMSRIMKFTQTEKQPEDGAKVAIAICKLMFRLFEASTWTEGFPHEFSQTAKAQDADPFIAGLNKSGQLMLPLKNLKLPRQSFPDAMDVPESFCYYDDELNLPKQTISKFVDSHHQKQCKSILRHELEF